MNEKKKKVIKYIEFTSLSQVKKWALQRVTYGLRYSIIPELTEAVRMGGTTASIRAAGYRLWSRVTKGTSVGVLVVEVVVVAAVV